eukprot:7336197-Prymnesium_polylepis.1
MSGPPRVEAAVGAPARFSEVPSGESSRPEYVVTSLNNVYFASNGGKPACREYHQPRGDRIDDSDRRSEDRY